MPGYTLYDILPSKKPYRLDRDTRRADRVVKFRSRESELKEDVYRAKCLDNTSGLNEVEAAQARDLSARLRKANETGEPASTLASAVYHREIRMPILESIWKLVEDPVNQPCAFVTLKPQDMLYPAGDLNEVSPASLMKRLRNHLDRSRVTAAKGFAFFGLDCEFDANRGGGVFDFHFHCTSAMDKVLAIENLREMSKYGNARQHPLERGLPVSPRVQIKSDLYNLPDPITYCLESWVPHRPTRVLPDGTLSRSATKRRIPSPYFQQWLIWMDQQRIQDFILLSNLRPTRTGLRLIRPYS